MKNLLRSFLLLCCIFAVYGPEIVKAESNQNEAFYGHYVPSETSIIKELVIEQNTFQIVLNNYSDTIPSDDNEASLKPNSQKVVIEFWDGEVSPMFAVNIYNPKYYFADNYLTITFPDKSTWSFELDVEQNSLEDHQNTTYVRSVEP